MQFIIDSALPRMTWSIVPPPHWLHITVKRFGKGALFELVEVRMEAIFSCLRTQTQSGWLKDLAELLLQAEMEYSPPWQQT